MFTTGKGSDYVAEKAESDTGWLFPVGDELNELGYKNVFFDDKKKSIYTSGWRMPPAKCEVVVTPTSLIKMWNTLKILNKFNKIIIMQASNTSLTGGSTPNGNYCRKVAIVNTLKLDKILLINNAEVSQNWRSNISKELQTC